MWAFPRFVAQYNVFRWFMHFASLKFYLGMFIAVSMLWNQIATGYMDYDMTSMSIFAAVSMLLYILFERDYFIKIPISRMVWYLISLILAFFVQDILYPPCPEEEPCPDAA